MKFQKKKWAGGIDDEQAFNQQPRRPGCETELRPPGVMYEGAAGSAAQLCRNALLEYVCPSDADPHPWTLIKRL